ncbi:hypothetical protein GRF29_154g160871 [Pseudopithomyces chartarum]|uniref:Mid2 domain-containing protein n=1 Tax=Pseudopithomyces chartarum TaxID=1892770 RepID=A0AAN6LUT7_9PLEO|nr:hypothetical protein GRF29_154g160871 [Pseudopithomyces chartarum]
MALVRSLYSLLAISFYIGNTFAERQCYALNGTQLGDEYGACNPNAKHSGCCAINGTAGTAELCLSNGLCMATNNEYMGTIWQNGCTDPTGADPSCPKICSDARSNLDKSVKAPAWNIQTCDFGSYCCRAADDKKSCCNNASVLKITTKSLGTLMLNSSTATNTSTTTSTSTSSSSTSAPTSSPTQLPITTTPSTTPSEPTSCAAEKRHTAIVGGTLSGIFSSIIVALLAAIYFLVQREKKQRKLKEHYEEQFATSAWGKYASGMGSKSTVSADVVSESEGKGVEVRYIGRRDT